jgi:hypothetical protein
MTKDEALKLALEALDAYSWEQVDAARAALRTAIEAAEKQKPVALETVYETIIHWDEGGGKRSRRELARRIVALYTTPQPQREWVGLTDEEVSDLWCEVSNTDFVTADTHVFSQAIEAKLKEKNT